MKVYSDSQKEWLPGKVQEVLYTVEYADGVAKTLPSGSKCLSKHCPAGGMSNSKGEETSKVEQVSPTVAHSLKAPPANAFSEGDELQVFQEKEQKWMPGRVTWVSCRLLYGDGSLAVQ